ncbi:MAG: hypothetical protein NTW14_08100 [bacterium]|nr:hypothetical protein [bacterium]
MPDSIIGMLVEELRGRINAFPCKHRLLRDNKVWYRLVSALDALQDSDEAIEFVFAESGLPKGGNLGQFILTVHGLFQTLIIQQDAIGSLSLALSSGGVKLFNVHKNSLLREIRKFRNEISGHPSEQITDKKNPGKVNFYQLSFDDFSRWNIKYGGFEENQERVWKVFDFYSYCTNQREIIIEGLRTMVTELDKSEQEYKDKFNKEKLSDILKKDHYPWFDKLECDLDREVQDRNYQGKLVLESVQNKIELLGRKLEERNLPLDVFNQYKEKIQYASERILRIFSFKVLGKRTLELEIYRFYLVKKWEELVEWTKGIDDYYDS